MNLRTVTLAAILLVLASIACGGTARAPGGDPSCSPVPEACNAKDDDCDGQVDEDFHCVFDGCVVAATSCLAGEPRTCNRATDVLPREQCGNGFDDDCNGKKDCEDPTCSKSSLLFSSDGHHVIAARRPDGTIALLELGPSPYVCGPPDFFERVSWSDPTTGSLTEPTYMQQHLGTYPSSAQLVADDEGVAVFQFEPPTENGRLVMRSMDGASIGDPVEVLAAPAVSAGFTFEVRSAGRGFWITAEAQPKGAKALQVGAARLAHDGSRLEGWKWFVPDMNVGGGSPTAAVATGSGVVLQWLETGPTIQLVTQPLGPDLSEQGPRKKLASGLPGGGRMVQGPTGALVLKADSDGISLAPVGADASVGPFRVVLPLEPEKEQWLVLGLTRATASGLLVTYEGATSATPSQSLTGVALLDSSDQVVWRREFLQDTGLSFEDSGIFTLGDGVSFVYSATGLGGSVVYAVDASCPGQ